MATASSRDVRTPSGQSNGRRVSQVELQQNVQRIATEFLERVAEAGEHAVDRAREPARREALVRHVLVYSASALDIATGPFPELNTLDMLVFSMLCRSALERHWIPQGLGDDGKALLAAFTHLERDMWNIAPKILDQKGATQLRELVASWKRANPDQFRVEGVRFQEFSEFAGTIETERARSARGVLRKVQAATQVADQALLMGERAFFVAHRLPFLIRLQARIGVQETLDDSLARLDNVKALLGDMPEVRPMLTDLVELTSSARAAAHEGRMLMAAADPQLQRLTEADGRELVLGMNATLQSANRLADRSLLLMREARGSLPSDPERSLAQIEQRVDSVLRRWVVYLLIVGFGWAVFFWSGYAVVKRLTSA
jgi:hypothetical protein